MSATISFTGGATATVMFTGTNPPLIQFGPNYSSGGVSDHRLLEHTDEPNLHPIQSITGLQLALNSKQPEILFAPEESVSSFSSWVRNVLATGLPTLSNIAGEATDTIIQWFAKLQGQINSNKSRLSVLENRVIAEIITTTDVEFVEFTLDNETNIEIQYSSMTGYDSDSILGFLYINGISTASYVAASTRYGGMLMYGGRYSFSGTMRVLVNNGICGFSNFVQTIAGLAATPATKNISTRYMSGYLETPITAINNIRITAPFRAGLSIKIIRL